MNTRLPALGKRGEGWVAVQLVLIAAVLFSALAGRGWSRSYAPAAYAVGGVLLALGLLLLVAAGLELGPGDGLLLGGADAPGPAASSWLRAPARFVSQTTSVGVATMIRSKAGKALLADWR